jgi:hypothetical protein
MREFIRTYGKLAGLFAAAALVLSFLTGILARNPIGTVLLRALLLAVLFGGLGIGLQFVVRRYLAGLGGEAPAETGRVEEGGSRIDIVLPEENPLVGDNASGTSEVPADLEAAPGDSAGAGEADAAGSIENPVGAGDFGGDDGAEGAEEAPGAMEALLPGEDPGGAADAAGGPTGPARAGQGAGRGVDVLPDIAGLEPAEGSRGRGRVPRKSFSGAAVDEALRRMVEDEDPATMARAVHTIVKRDEKG